MYFRNGQAAYSIRWIYIASIVRYPLLTFFQFLKKLKKFWSQSLRNKIQILPWIMKWSHWLNLLLIRIFNLHLIVPILREDSAIPLIIHRLGSTLSRLKSSRLLHRTDSSLFLLVPSSSLRLAVSTMRRSSASSPPHLRHCSSRRSTTSFLVQSSFGRN